ncbi:hypothetical protein J3F83DRAFT_545168 [Trichoderma novae-zelandiae]
MAMMLHEWRISYRCLLVAVGLRLDRARKCLSMNKVGRWANDNDGGEEDKEEKRRMTVMIVMMTEELELQAGFVPEKYQRLGGTPAGGRGTMVCLPTYLGPYHTGR